MNDEGWPERPEEEQDWCPRPGMDEDLGQDEKMRQLLRPMADESPEMEETDDGVGDDRMGTQADEREDDEWDGDEDVE